MCTYFMQFHCHDIHCCSCRNGKDSTCALAFVLEQLFWVCAVHWRMRNEVKCTTWTEALLKLESETHALTVTTETSALMTSDVCLLSYSWLYVRLAESQPLDYNWWLDAGDGCKTTASGLCDWLIVEYSVDDVGVKRDPDCWPDRWMGKKKHLILFRYQSLTTLTARCSQHLKCHVVSCVDVITTVYD